MLSRRDFLKGLLASLALLGFSPLINVTRAVPKFERPGPIWGMAIDLRKCIGCNACAVACMNENNVVLIDETVDPTLNPDIRRRGMRRILIEEVKLGEFPRTGFLFISRMCQHCENPPCAKVCPVRATYKKENGIVIINYARCIGCRYCIAACVYNARRFHWKQYSPLPYTNLKVPIRIRGVVDSCNFCHHLVERDKMPACVDACVGRAMIFGDLTDPNSEIVKTLSRRYHFRLLEEAGTEPKVFYVL